jgi:hypothetical protein
MLLVDGGLPVPGVADQDVARCFVENRALAAAELQVDAGTGA